MLEIMKGEVLFVVLLGVLLFVSAIQAVELIKLSELVKTNGITGRSTGMENSGVNLPASLKNVPDMVGGC